jgi:hypothetical protein
MRLVAVPERERDRGGREGGGGERMREREGGGGRGGESESARERESEIKR